MFSAVSSITTSDYTDGLSLPSRPGCFKQAFDKSLTFDELWRIHQDGESYLCEQYGIVRGQFDAPFVDSFVRVIDRGITYVQSLPLWPLRGIYWVLVSRPALANKSVREMFERGTYRTWGAASSW